MYPKTSSEVSGGQSNGAHKKMWALGSGCVCVFVWLCMHVSQSRRVDFCICRGVGGFWKWLELCQRMDGGVFRWPFLCTFRNRSTKCAPVFKFLPPGCEKVWGGARKQELWIVKLDFTLLLLLSQVWPTQQIWWMSHPQKYITNSKTIPALNSKVYFLLQCWLAHSCRQCCALFGLPFTCIILVFTLF